jgi:hypothetical protein
MHVLQVNKCIDAHHTNIVHVGNKRAFLFVAQYNEDNLLVNNICVIIVLNVFRAGGRDLPCQRHDTK